MSKEDTCSVRDIPHVATADATLSISSIKGAVEKVPRSLARDRANELVGVIKREVTAKWVPDCCSEENCLTAVAKRID